MSPPLVIIMFHANLQIDMILKPYSHFEIGMQWTLMSHLEQTGGTSLKAVKSVYIYWLYYRVRLSTQKCTWGHDSVAVICIIELTAFMGKMMYYVY